ncbi:MAG: hypothetical protein ACIAS6_05120 [Phycisphaerales bacterium JB060]
MRWWHAQALAILCWLLFAPGLLAQPAERMAAPTVLLDLGFNGQLPAQKWAPVRIVVSAMDEPVEATASIQITAPSGDTLTTLTPIATTPGRETITSTTVWVPPSIASIHVELIAQSGASLAGTSYGAAAGAQAIELLPPSVMPIIWGVSSPSLRMAFGDQNYEREFFGTAGELLRARAAVAKVGVSSPQHVGGPPWLPTTPMAYQGLAAVVIDGSMAARLEPEGLRAMRTWLISGGRLMIANADNNALRLLLGEHLPQGMSIGPARATPLPAVMGGPGEITARAFDPRDLPQGWVSPIDANHLTAFGPVGLGRVCIAGFDPDSLADQERIAAAETAWHTTLATLIMDRLERGRNELGLDTENELPVQSTSIMAALNWVSKAPAVGLGAFLAIFAMMLSLAIALGPVDRFALKRLRSLHRWWLTALAWITLATVGAWLIPTRVRSGPTSVGSIRVVDAWQDTDGTTRAWQTTVSGMFLNRSATIELDDLEPTAWLSPISHPWRPGNIGSLSMISAGTAPQPLPTTGRLWTIRNFQQHGETMPPVWATFSSSDERFELRLAGPMADSVDAAAVRTGGRWLHLLPGGSPRLEDGARVIGATPLDLVLRPPSSFDLRDVSSNHTGWWAYLNDDRPLRPPPSIALQLPGPEERGPALQALSATDQWAVVYLTWNDQQPLIGTEVGETFDTTWICRLAVPVEGAP